MGRPGCLPAKAVPYRQATPGCPVQAKFAHKRSLVTVYAMVGINVDFKRYRLSLWFIVIVHRWPHCLSGTRTGNVFEAVNYDRKVLSS